MEFCPECDALLIPKKGTDELVCPICKKSYKIDKNKAKAEYKIGHKRNNKKLSSKTPILENKVLTKTISEDDRKAFEDYFQSNSS
ncbi:MAG: hypothetical protein ACTSU2_09665 [Promethearchaeota archaeon]